jgi:hypothetical protein
MTRKCSNCFRAKPVSEFYRKLASYQSRCKACNAEVVRSFAHSRRQRLIQERWDAVYGRVRSGRKSGGNNA